MTLTDYQKKLLAESRKEFLFWYRHHGTKANQTYENLSLQMLTIAGLFITFSSVVITINKQDLNHVARGFLIQSWVSLLLSVFAAFLFLFFLHQWNYEAANWNAKKAKMVLDIENPNMNSESSAEIGFVINEDSKKFGADWILALQAFLFALGVISMILFGIIQIS